MTITSTPLARVQRRTLLTLMAAQLVGGTGLAAAVTVGGIIAAELGGPSVSGLPLAAAVGGTAVAALAIGALMRRHGRRRGLRWGWQAGAAGAALAIGATTIGNLPLLLAAMVLFGGGEAASAAARFAATDLAGRRGAAMGGVLSATAVAITAGPTLVGPTAHLATGLGLPPLAGPFLLAAVAFAAAATIIGIALRPDPLLLAAERRGTVPHDDRAPGPVLALLIRSPARHGLAALVTANVVMVGIMTIAPIHLAHGEHGGDATALSGVGFVIGLHAAGMYAPAPLTGWLADRFGYRWVIVLGGATLTLAGSLATRADASDIAVVATALFVLGLGWNLAFVGGSVALTSGIAEAERPRVQAAADATMALAGMLGSAASGLVLSAGGFASAGTLGAALATLLTLSVLWTARRSVLG